MSVCQSNFATAFLKGRKSGELLRAAEAAGYEVLLTVDQGIPFQQALAGRKISIVSMRSRTNQLEDLTPLANSVLKALVDIGAGQIVTVG